MLSTIIAISVSLFLLLFAYVFYRIRDEVTQEGDTFWNVVGTFLTIYTLAVVGMYYLLPPLPGGADLSSFVELTDPSSNTTILTRGEGEIIELP